MYIPSFKQPRKQLQKALKKYQEFFFQAVKAYTVEEFEYHMNDLEKIDERITLYLKNNGYHRWAKPFSINNIYLAITSNIVESMKAMIKKAKDLPITTLLQYLHALVQEWTYINRNLARSIFNRLAKSPYDIINDN